MNSKKSLAKPVSTKLQQFLEEINSLSKLYQYQLTATLKFTKKGIVPTLEVVDILPKKKGKKKEKKDVK